jgi:hypothetical protein
VSSRLAISRHNLRVFSLGPDEWLLFLKLPDDAARKKPQRKPDVIQLPLPDLDVDRTACGSVVHERAAGDVDGGGSHGASLI